MDGVWSMLPVSDQLAPSRFSVKCANVLIKKRKVQWNVVWKCTLVLLNVI